MSLVKKRRDPFIVEIKGSEIIQGYDIDKLDRYEIAHVLTDKLNRNEIKKLLCSLSEGFKEIIKNAPTFKNSKEENIYFYNILKNKYLELKEYDDTELCNLRADEIFELSEEKEEEVKRLKKGCSFLCSFEEERLKQAEKELLELSEFDCDSDCELKEFDMLSKIKEILAPLDCCYSSEITESSRIRESRNRDLYLVYIFQGLGFFLDYYLPSGLEGYDKERAEYSVFDILVLCLMNGSKIDLRNPCKIWGFSRYYQNKYYINDFKVLFRKEVKKYKSR